MFPCIFLNKHILVTNQDIDMKFCKVLLHTYSEGMVSQVFYLGPSFYFMFFRK